MNKHDQVLRPTDLLEMDTAQLHKLVYQDLFARIAARSGRAEAERHLLRFKVLGGLGPAATVDFLQELIAATPAAGDRQHLRLDVMIDPLMGQFGEDSPLQATQQALDALLEGDAQRTVFCLPCNSAHWRIEHLSYDRARVSFVSMIEATVKAVRSHGPRVGCVGLLATGPMVASNMYQAAFAEAGVLVVAPQAGLQQRIDAAIYGGTVDGRVYAGVKGGDLSEEATALVQAAVDQLSSTHAMQALCVSCTELPLLFGPQRVGPFKGDAHGLPVINSTQALAREFVHQALRIQAEQLLKNTAAALGPRPT